MVEDEDLLLAVLNSAPVVGGRQSEELTAESWPEFTARFGGTGSPGEREQVRQVRDVLHHVIRGDADALDGLAESLEDAVLVPQVSAHGIHWALSTHPDGRIPARAVMAWSRILHDAPGRLRPCANDECNLFLIDRSRPGTAKWCSMATCGNRMKARAHASRQAKTASA
ncbi:CGNR zinc finger domain-containing protein [Arthrobacter sp. Ld5]|uniref:CGNR zinc finger domain-containing protein n=1 Tax=Arthrobacter sp. Ld5 TaxID=649152 RepID=UPI003EBA5679